MIAAVHRVSQLQGGTGQPSPGHCQTHERSPPARVRPARPPWSSAPTLHTHSSSSSSPTRGDVHSSTGERRPRVRAQQVLGRMHERCLGTVPPPLDQREHCPRLEAHRFAEVTALNNHALTPTGRSLRRNLWVYIHHLVLSSDSRS